MVGSLVVDWPYKIKSGLQNLHVIILDTKRDIIFSTVSVNFVI